MKAVLDTSVLVAAFVSDDMDLLVLDNCRGVKIITPRTFESLFKD